MQRGLVQWSKKLTMAPLSTPSARATVITAPLLSKSGGGSIRSFTSAFEPMNAYNVESVQNKQKQSFIKTLEENEEALAMKLTPDELEKLKWRALKMSQFDEINEKMTQLFSPQRHKEIRKTRTWAYITEAVDQYFKDDEKAAEKLVFGDDEQFKEQFKKLYLIDDSRNHYLSAMCLADLRFSAATLAIEKSTGFPAIIPVFGVRNSYHYKVPDPYSPSAEYQSIANSRVYMRTIVMCTIFSGCVREGRTMTPQWFAEMLASEADNNLKSDPRWYECAEVDKFEDQLERQWIWFQTDPGVTKLKPKFPTDYYNNEPFTYRNEYLWEDKGKYYVE